MKEHGLRLVVARVPGRDRARTDLARRAAEELVPRGARRVLGPRRLVSATDADRRTDAVGELRNEVRVLRTLLGTRAVIEVRDMDDDAELVRELREDEQERGRVGSARDRDDHGARREDPVRADVVAHGRPDRGRRHWWLGWGSDPRPRGYESRALPLSYPAGLMC